jgi:hypothetical protein
MRLLSELYVMFALVVAGFGGGFFFERARSRRERELLARLRKLRASARRASAIARRHAVEGVVVFCDDEAFSKLAPYQVVPDGGSQEVN